MARDLALSYVMEVHRSRLATPITMQNSFGEQVTSWSDGSGECNTVYYNDYCD